MTRLDEKTAQDMDRILEDIIMKQIEEMTPQIKIKKITPDVPDLIKVDKGDWIDLYVANGSTSTNSKIMIERVQNEKDNDFDKYDMIHYRAGDIVWVGFGIAMQLPKGYEGEIRPRSSTFKNTGLLFTNSVGTIDESYCGDNDEWRGMFYATRDGHIQKHERLVQFRITEKMDKFRLTYVDMLGNDDRGGYGTTGQTIQDLENVVEKSVEVKDGI